MFYIDTPRKQVLAFDFDNELGDISNERVAIDTEKLGIAGSPDGMAIDANDNLWIAFCHGSSVVCLDSRTGAILDRVDLPVQEVTACAFGGDDLDVLYITTGLHKTEKEKDAGRVFVAKPGVRGVPAVAYQG
jgi:sugar lactone lactonase YvrE